MLDDIATFIVFYYANFSVKAIQKDALTIRSIIHVVCVCGGGGVEVTPRYGFDLPRQPRGATIVLC